MSKIRYPLIGRISHGGALTELAKTLHLIAAAADIATFAPTASVETEMVRSGFVPDTPANFLETVFAMEPGEVETVPYEGRLIVAFSTQKKHRRTIPIHPLWRRYWNNSFWQSYAQDPYSAFSAGVVSKTDVSLNQQLINGLHAQIQ